MNRPVWMLPSTGLAIMAAAASSFAHVPYIESQDYTEETPFLVENVEQSKAIYAWLQDSNDVDVYVIPIREPSRLYVKSLVPYCEEYLSFRPSFAIQGPQLKGQDSQIPLTPIEGSGVEVFHDRELSGGERPSKYEYYSDQFYFEGPIYQTRIVEPGLYKVVFWDPQGDPGDYVAVFGRREVFGPEDWQLSRQNTPVVRRREQLHGNCTLDF